MRLLYAKLLGIALVTLQLGVALAEPAMRPLETVRLAQFGKAKFLLYLPLYLAEEEGYLRDEGVQLEVSFAGNDDQVFATLVSGSADVAVGDPIFTAIAAERGFPAKTVALLVSKLGVYGYAKAGAVRKIENAADLSGLRVGSYPAPSTTYALLQELNRSGKLSRPITVVEGAQGTQFPMLVSGTVDVGIDLEPAVSVVEAKGYGVIFDMTKFSDAQAVTGLMTTARMIGERPAALQGLVRGVDRALKVLRQDRSVGYRTAMKLYPEIEPEILRRAVDRLVSSECFPSGAEVTDAAWQRSVRTRLESKELKAPQATAVAVDNRFVPKDAVAVR